MSTIPSNCTVAVVGGGLAGLTAVYHLQERGMNDVLLFEALQRPGGRVHTLHTPSGQHYEVGALSFTDVEKTLWSFVHRFSLEYIEHSPIDKQFYFRGIKGHFSEKGSFLSPSEKEISLNHLLSHYLPLIDKDKEMSFAESLIQAGASPTAVDWLNKNTLIGLCGEGLGSVSTKAALQFCRQYDGATHAYSFKGGNDSLPKAFAKAISNQIFYDCAIEKIERKASSVLLTTKKGEQISAKKVICTVPLHALSAIHFSPPLSLEKQQAISAIPYTSFTSVMLEGLPQSFSKEVQGGCFAITDTPSGWFRNQTLFQNHSDENTVVTFTATGEQARKFTNLTEPERRKEILQGLCRFNSNFDEQKVRTRLFSWDQEPWIQGAYSYFPPNTFPLQSVLAEPEGEVHFAGEHTSDKFASMNGAIESGIRAAEEAFSSINH
ncbi:MAG TPA: NAD(P)/FAD-dependent oxidoreductase [Rhabdochlamydiaceae bacterium]|nr:NAD(P)/FAD-dependent oxidoreductase [Rhabdochlamydiaceae bacterium]